MRGAALAPCCRTRMAATSRVEDRIFLIIVFFAGAGYPIVGVDLCEEGFYSGCLDVRESKEDTQVGRRNKIYHCADGGGGQRLGGISRRNRNGTELCHQT